MSMSESGKEKRSSSLASATVTAAANQNDQVKLEASMSLLNGINVIIGCMIGSGIFISPKGVLSGTGSVGLSLIVWFLSGVFSLVGSYCYAELGTMIPKSGADYAYIMESFGPLAAFLRLWIECMIVRPCNAAIISMTFAFYALRPFYPDSEPPLLAIRLLAIVCLSILTYINCASVRWSTKVQDLTTYGKLSALLMIIVSGLYQLYHGNVKNFTFDIDSSFRDINITSVALSFYSGLFAYNGWNYLNFVIEELKNPEKNLPRAIFISCSVVTAVYTLTIVAYHSTLSVQEVLSAEAVAVTFAERLYGWMAWVVPVFVAMSTFGGVNGILLTSSRLFYAGAEERQMPQVLAMIQVEKLTPTLSVVAIFFLSLLYMLYDDIYTLINYVGFANWLAIGVSVTCVPYLRWRRPDLPRPIRISLMWPLLYIICTIFIVVVPVFADPYGTLAGLAMILSALPVYALFISWRSKPKWFDRLVLSVTIFLQKLFFVVPSG